MFVTAGNLKSVQLLRDHVEIDEIEKEMVDRFRAPDCYSPKAAFSQKLLTPKGAETCISHFIWSTGFSIRYLKMFVYLGLKIKKC